MNLQKLCDIALTAATEAGELIAYYFASGVEVEQKRVGESKASQVVTAVDRKSQEIILKHLKPSCQTFDLALLAEESEDDKSRLVKDFFWCIDPLDGTLPFIEKKNGFAVSIALLAKDGTPQIGVVYDPLTKNTYHAIKGQGTYKNGKPFEVEAKSKALTFVTDRGLLSHPQFNEVKSKLENHAQVHGLEGIKLITHGGAVMNAVWVLENSPSCYFKFPKPQAGGGSLWDFAATTCIFHELNLAATNFYGQALDLNRKESTFMNHEGVYFGSGILTNWRP